MRRSESDKIFEMHKRIEQIKSSEEIGVRFMQAWEEKIYDKQEARAEGRAEVILKLFAKGQSPDIIADVLERPLAEIQEIISQSSLNNENP